MGSPELGEPGESPFDLRFAVPLFRGLEIPVQNPLGDQSPERALGDQFGIALQVGQPDQTAVSLLGVAVTGHRIRYGLRRERVEQGRIVGRQEDA